MDNEKFNTERQTTEDGGVSLIRIYSRDQCTVKHVYSDMQWEGNLKHGLGLDNSKHIEKLLNGIEKSVG